MDTIFKVYTTCIGKAIAQKTVKEIEDKLIKNLYDLVYFQRFKVVKLLV